MPKETISGEEFKTRVKALGICVREFARRSGYHYGSTQYMAMGKVRVSDRALAYLEKLEEDKKVFDEIEAQINEAQEKLEKMRSGNV